MTDRNIQDIYALTPMQEGILYHSIQDPASGSYFNQFSCNIDGTINPVLFEKAWQQALQRHDVLRTLFTWEKRDRPLQIVRRRADLPWTLIDLRDRDESAQEATLREYLAADRQRGFPLDTAPLTRVALFLLDAERSRLLWSFHHIVLDGWSMRLVFDQVLESYQRLLEGGARESEPAPQFAAFVAWQQARNQAGDAEFWKDRLAGFTEPLKPDIAPGRQSDARSGKPGRQTERTLDLQLSESLREFARRQRVTLNSVVVSAWAVLLARYCDTNDIVFGVTVAGRSNGPPGIEQTAGLCINTVPLRLAVEPGMEPAELLAKTQAQLLAQQPYEQAALGAIQKCADLAPGTRLFETIVVFENLPEAAPQAHRALEISDRQFIEYSNFPLALLVVPGEALHLIAVHDERRYPRDATEGLLRSLQHILTEFTARETPALDNIAAIPPAERDLLLNTWNDTARRLAPRATSVVDLFEQTVSRQPGSIAITTDRESVSYEVLNFRANRLAHHLLENHQARGRPMIVYAERSADAIVCMLAALKSGAFYVPLDVNDPGSRLAQVTEDLARGLAMGEAGEKPILLTQSPLLDKVADLPVEVIVADALVDTGKDNNPERRPCGDDLAYVIYTSGSQGRPKGVMIQHSALLNSTLARYEFYDDSPGCFALLSSLATDSSLAGVYWTLCGGGELVIPGHRSELAVDTLTAMIEKRSVTHMLCVPSLYSLILEHAEPQRLRSLRVIIVAGEASNTALVASHYQLLADARLYNEYGPSEACVWATAAVLEPGDVSIGKPIANTRVYVLDAGRRPMPVGVPGELYIGGANLALGYLGNDEATAASFVDNPFDGGTGRLYRTGDRVRFRNDGKLEFIGRIDNQIKVRGYRVEPGEIEAVLLAHPAVDAAAVFIEDRSPAVEPLETLIAQADERLLSGLLDDVVALESEDVRAELVRAAAEENN